MSKCTLVIDGNWLLMSRFSMVREEFDAKLSNDLLQAAKDNLKDFMARSIILQINNLDSIVDNIILVTDGGSWRKKVERPETLQEDYKANRKKSEEIAWDYVFDSLNELRDNAASLGITACKEWEVEGDDWCAYWSKYLNDRNINCIIWSTDGDLKQLITNKDGIWTVTYNEQYGLTMHNSLNEIDCDEISFFMNANLRSEILEKLQERNIKATKYINPDDVIMDKVICGDGGDNIKAIIRVKSSGKEYHYTEKMWKSLKERMDIKDLNDFVSRKEEIISEMIASRPNKFKEYNFTEEQAAAEFDYNYKIVRIFEMPDHIVSKMEAVEYKEPRLDYIKNNFKALSGENTSQVESLLENIDTPDFLF